MLLSIIAGLFLKPVLAAVYTDPAKLPVISYTHIIVGAGVGGSVLANRLSANPKNCVLLVEAGPSDTVDPSIPIPFLAPTLAPSAVSWNYTTVSQAGLGGRSVKYPRGYTLGGSTSINYMVWTRGPACDYNRLAQFTSDSGWYWDSLLPTMMEVETLVPPPDGHDVQGEINTVIHGTSGPVKISVQDGCPLGGRIYNTTGQLPEFPLTQDMNSGNPLGIGWAQYSIGGGQRSSASVSYLTPALSRSNFDILVGAQVTKVVRTGYQDNLPVFRAVMFAQTATSPTYIHVAIKEVILCAGAINTPQILMLSGIGDSKKLAKLEIDTLVTLPDVGMNMQDHVVLPNVFSVNSDSTNDDIGRSATLYQNYLTQWEQSRTGPFAASVVENLGFLRLPNNSTIFKSVTDPSSGPEAPHFEFLFGNGFRSFVDSTPTTGHYMMIATSLMTPTSRGSITLTSTSAFVEPAIDPGLLSSPFDIFTLCEAVKAALRFVKAPAWKDYVIGPYGPLADAQTDDQIEAYIRSHATAQYHPTGTAFMSPYGASRGVVNPDFSVKGTMGLRIVDASILPYIPAAHPQAALYAMAERAAKIIDAD